MIQRGLVVFDEFLVATSPTSPAKTSDAFLETLGSYDQLQLQVLVDRNTVGAFDLFVEHSADGVFYYPWNRRDDTVPSYGDIAFTSLDTANANIGWATVGGSVPLFAYVRLFLFFDDESRQGHVRIIAHQRDHDKGMRGEDRARPGQILPVNTGTTWKVPNPITGWHGTGGPRHDGPILTPGRKHPTK